MSTPAAETAEASSAKQESTLPEPSDTDTKNGVTLSLPPSHILEDGRLIYLPLPNAAERTRFFERSIARHGLLQADMEKSDGSKDDEKKDDKDVQTMLQDEKDEDETKKDKTAPKIHPLAVASARLQSNGLNELNRAINLATLVSTGEFFSYTNVVDPSYDNPEADKNKPKAEAAAYYSEKATSQRTEALFGLKRKRAQFEKASEVLQRHNQRLWDGIQAQHAIDRRLFELRQQWRLVAPEHGTRARLHAARTNEVCVDHYFVMLCFSIKIIVVSHLYCCAGYCGRCRCL